MVIVLFHSKMETNRQYRLKNNYDQFFEKKIRNVGKMMEIAKCSIFRIKVFENRTI